MKELLYRRVVMGLAVVVVGGLCANHLQAQSQDKGTGHKGPAPDADFQTMTGQVTEFTIGSKEEIDGLILADGTVLHWPPHLADRFSSMVVKGDMIRVSGYIESDLDNTKLEVSSLKNMRTGMSMENPNRPPP